MIHIYKNHIHVCRTYTSYSTGCKTKMCFSTSYSVSEAKLFHNQSQLKRHLSGEMEKKNDMGTFSHFRHVVRYISDVPSTFHL